MARWFRWRRSMPAMRRRATSWSPVPVLCLRTSLPGDHDKIPLTSSKMKSPAGFQRGFLFQLSQIAVRVAFAADLIHVIGAGIWIITLPARLAIIGGAGRNIEGVLVHDV